MELGQGWQIFVKANYCFSTSKRPLKKGTQKYELELLTEKAKISGRHN